eukprot:5298808-Karenia_brevis.AAC.1
MDLQACKSCNSLLASSSNDRASKVLCGGGVTGIRRIMYNGIRAGARGSQAPGLTASRLLTFNAYGIRVGARGSQAPGLCVS